MSLRFCMLESVKGGQVAVNLDAVVAVRSDGAQTVVVYSGGLIAVKGIVPEVVLQMLGAAATAPESGEQLKSAA